MTDAERRCDCGRGEATVNVGDGFVCRQCAAGIYREAQDADADDDDQERPPQDRTPEGERLRRRREKRRKDGRARKRRLGLNRGDGR